MSFFMLYDGSYEYQEITFMNERFISFLFCFSNVMGDFPA